jgi:hypothetical protein
MSKVILVMDGGTLIFTTYNWEEMKKALTEIPDGLDFVVPEVVVDDKGVESTIWTSVVKSKIMAYRNI